MRTVVDGRIILVLSGNLLRTSHAETLPMLLGLLISLNKSQIYNLCKIFPTKTFMMRKKERKKEGREGGRERINSCPVLDSKLLFCHL